MRFSPDGAGLYAALAWDDETTALLRTPRAGNDSKALTRLDGSAVALLPARDSRTLFLALNGNAGGRVIFLDAGTLQERRRLDVCGGVRGLAGTADGERLYLLCGGDRIAEIDAGLEIVIRTQALPAACDAPGLAVSRTDVALLVPCPVRGQLWYLDRRTLQPFDSLALPDRAHALAVTSDRGRVLLTVPDQRRVVIVDPARGTIVARVEIPFVPTGVSVAGPVAYVSAGSAVLALDWTSGRALRQVTVRGSARVVASWPAPREPRMRWYAR